MDFTNAANFMSNNPELVRNISLSIVNNPNLLRCIQNMDNGEFNINDFIMALSAPIDENHLTQEELEFQNKAKCVLGDIGVEDLKDFVDSSFQIIQNNVQMPDMENFLAIMDEKENVPDTSFISAFILNRQANSIQESINLFIDAMFEEDAPLCEDATYQLKHLKIFETDSGSVFTCSICLVDHVGKLEECSDISFDMIELPCYHMFDKSCILTWLNRKNNCPLCRKIVEIL
jgi:hypothetical protein